MVLVGAPAQVSQDYELIEADFSILTPQRWLKLVALPIEREIILRLRFIPPQQLPPPSGPATQRGSMPYSLTRGRSRDRAMNRHTKPDKLNMSHRAPIIQSGPLDLYRKPRVQQESKVHNGSHQFSMPRQTAPADLSKPTVFGPVPGTGLYGLDNDLPYTPSQAAPYVSTLYTRRTGRSYAKMRT